jgi:hypothetical protein
MILEEFSSACLGWPGGKKTPNLDIRCQNKLGKESPKLRLNLPKYF